eukprot:UN31770
MNNADNVKGDKWSDYLESQLWSETQIIKQGWLNKQGDRFKKWRKRWCVLFEDGTFRYYTKMQMDEKYRKDNGNVSFKNLSIYGHDKQHFWVGTESRVWKFEAENAKAAEDWIMIITRKDSKLDAHEIMLADVNRRNALKEKKHRPSSLRRPPAMSSVFSAPLLTLDKIPSEINLEESSDEETQVDGAEGLGIHTNNIDQKEIQMNNIDQKVILELVLITLNAYETNGEQSKKETPKRNSNDASEITETKCESIQLRTSISLENPPTRNRHAGHAVERQDMPDTPSKRLPEYSANPSMAEGLIVKQGWLKKQGYKFKTWKRRWCVLFDDGRFNYFTSKRKRKDRGDLNLINDGTITVGQDVAKFFIDSSSRKWLFEAKDLLKVQNG